MHSVNTDVSRIFYYSRFVGFSQDFLGKKKNAAREYPGLVRVLQMCCMDGLSTRNGTDVLGTGWNPGQMSDVPKSHSHDLHADTQGLAEKTWGNIKLPRFSFFFLFFLPWGFIGDQDTSFEDGLWGGEGSLLWQAIVQGRLQALGDISELMFG